MWGSARLLVNVFRGVIVDMVLSVNLVPSEATSANCGWSFEAKSAYLDSEWDEMKVPILLGSSRARSNRAVAVLAVEACFEESFLGKAFRGGTPWPGCISPTVLSRRKNALIIGLAT